MECVSIRQLGAGAVDWTAPTPLTGFPPAGLQLKNWPGIKPEVKRQFAGLSVWVAALYAPLCRFGPIGHEVIKSAETLGSKGSKSSE